MTIITSPSAMRAWTAQQKSENHRVGFVPTMGYLHQGHLSLVSLARTEGKCDRVVMSIFVNPTQFGPNEDFEKYPRDLERDRAMAETAGVDVLFFPSVDAMYSGDATTMVDVGAMGTVMCGISRPTHFRGVTTVVAKLFSIVRPDTAVFGQKDAQQFFIIERMTRDLHMDVALIMAPIRREQDGLAMSSRNVYLNTDERRQALALNEALREAESLIRNGERNVDVIRTHMESIFARYPLVRKDYIAMVEAGSLVKREVIQGRTLIAVAAYLGKTRLIDNIIITV